MNSFACGSRGESLFDQWLILLGLANLPLSDGRDDSEQPTPTHSIAKIPERTRESDACKQRLGFFQRVASPFGL
jgi:hypothetical protein